MTRNQIARINAYTVSLAFLNKHRAYFSDTPAFEKNFQAASQLLEEIEIIKKRRAEKLSGKSSKVQVQPDELAAEAADIATVIANYATSAGDQQLLESINFFKSELRNADYDKAMEYCRAILEKADELSTVLESYGMYRLKLFKYRISVQRLMNKKAKSTDTGGMPGYTLLKLKETLRMLNGIFLEKMDIMMLPFKTSHRDFYAQYINRRAIVNPGPRSTRIAGRVVAKASNEELSKVYIWVEETGACVISNLDGTYVIKSPVREKVTVVFEKEGYKKAIAEVYVKSGQATAVNIEMEKIFDVSLSDSL